MHINDAFPSKYLKASDLRGKDVSVIISGYRTEKFKGKSGGEETKLVLEFEGKPKGLVCNKTNARTIAKKLGGDLDEWVGKEIVLFPTEVEFGGDTMEAIRVRGLSTKADMDDEIPF